MENKDKVKYLKQYQDITKEIVENENRYAVLRARLTAPGIQRLTDMPIGTDCNNNKILDGVAELIELEELLNGQQRILMDIQKNIQMSINALEDSLHRRLMTIRYIDGKGWEKVCVELNYCWKQTHRKHSEALNQIQINNDTK